MNFTYYENFDHDIHNERENALLSVNLINLTLLYQKTPQSVIEVKSVINFFGLFNAYEGG